MTIYSAPASSPPRAPRLSSDRMVVPERTSLPLQAGMSIDEWCRLGVQINSLSNSSTWWLGDWLIYGRETYPGRYREAIRSTSLDYQTLRNYAWVASRISPERRRAGLSFQHHAEVAPLAPPLQDEWLARAEAAGWSRNRLRTEIRTATRGAGEIGGTVRLRVEDDHLRRWRSAASSDGQELVEWMVGALDEAARSAVVAP